MTIATQENRKSPEFRKALEALREAAGDLQGIVEMYSRVDHPAETAALTDMLASALLLREIVHDLYDEPFGREHGTSLVWAIRRNLDLDPPAATPESAAEPVESPSPEPIAMPQRDEQPEAEPGPKWCSSTPPECDYCLTMFSHAGSALEDIYVSRDEYVYLKRCLAERRGIRHDLPEVVL